MITIETLLESPYLENLKTIAGHTGTNREVKSVSIMDAPDSYKWLKGGEFILTTGFIFGGDDWQLEHYVENLIKADCSAIGIKKGRFLNAIPESVKHIAEQNDFPIIEIPYTFGWSDIISVFYDMQRTPSNALLKEISYPAFRRPSAMYMNNDEEFYCNFLLKLHSGDITTSDIHDFSKYVKADDKTEFCIAFIEGIDKDKILDNVRNALGDSIRNQKFNAKTYFALSKTEQIIIALIEVCSVDKEPLEELQYSLVELLEQYLRDVDVGSISMGRLYANVDGIIKSYKEAIESYTVGRVIWKDKHCYFYTTLSVYSTLRDVDASAIALDYIQTLKRHQERFDYDCIECLEVYLEYGYKKAATKLFLHENTLRYRIRNIEDILHLDLHDKSICNVLVNQIKLWQLRKSLK